MIARKSSTRGSNIARRLIIFIAAAAALLAVAERRRPSIDANFQEAGRYPVSEQQPRMAENFKVALSDARVLCAGVVKVGVGLLLERR